jgi:glycosyltransferase involved in cell wall biosynthesis
MKPLIDKICILNAHELSPNKGGSIGVFREAFSKVTGVHWELRSFCEVKRLTAAPAKLTYRLSAPLLWGYSRKAKLHRNIANQAALFRNLREINRYRAIWFSDVEQYFACRPLLAPYQKTVLHLHCPELPSREAAEHGWYSPTDIELIAKVERWAFHDADLIVLANEGCKEIYGELSTKAKRITYLPNALSGNDPGECPILSDDHTNLIFIGRRNKVKGFDVLIEAFKAAHAVDHSLRLYLLGDGEPIMSPGVVDLGFSQTPDKWLAAASCVVIPNRSSYLDLNLIQALSLNVPVIMTCTQGHRIMRESSAAIYELDSASVACLTNALIDAPRWLGTLGSKNQDNRLLFEHNYSLDIFRRRLDSICEDLISETISYGATKYGSNGVFPEDWSGQSVPDGEERASGVLNRT